MPSLASTTARIGTFATIAPRYWDAGYTVIPVGRPDDGKASAISSNGLVNQIPHASTKERLIRDFGDKGLGLLMGQEAAGGSRTLAIDVDDDRVARFVRYVIGGDAPAKFGAKGITVFALLPKGVKTGKNIVNQELGTKALVEFPAMTVLPPTVHPDAGKPYRWVSDRTLPDTQKDYWPEVPQWKFDFLHRALRWKRLGELWGEGTRHNAVRDLIFYSMGWFGPDEDDPLLDSLLEAMVCLLPEDAGGDTVDELQGRRGGSELGWGALRDDRSGGKHYPRPSDEKGAKAGKLLEVLEDSLGGHIRWRSCFWTPGP